MKDYDNHEPGKPIIPHVFLLVCNYLNGSDERGEDIMILFGSEVHELTVIATSPTFSV